MKKILGISLVALFAAAPMMAQASQVAFEGTLNQQTNKYEVGANGQIATTSYVKGAYNALGEVINTKQDQLTAGGSNIQTAVVQSAAIHDTTSAGLEAASDSSLVTEKAVLTAIDASKSATQTLTNKTIDASSNTITNLTTNAIATDAKATAIRSEGAVDSKLATEKAVADAIKTVNSAAASLTEDVAANTSAIAKLNASDSTEGSVKYEVKQEATARATAITNAINSEVTNRNAAISAAVSALSATESQVAADSNGQLELNITQVDGVITSISGSIKSAIDSTLSDQSDNNHVAGALAVYNAVEGAKSYADGLAGNYDAAGAADSALQSAKNYTDAKILTVATTWGSDTATSTVHLENPGA